MHIKISREWSYKVNKNILLCIDRLQKDFQFFATYSFIVLFLFTISISEVRASLELSETPSELNSAANWSFIGGNPYPLQVNNISWTYYNGSSVLSSSQNNNTLLDNVYILSAVPSLSASFTNPYNKNGGFPPNFVTDETVTVNTNSSFKERFNTESLMEPGLVNVYELRHTENLERRYGDTPNQLIILMLANLCQKKLDALSKIERWSYLMYDESLRSGIAKVKKTKDIDDVETLVAGDDSLMEFIQAVNVNNIEQDMWQTLKSRIDYDNDSLEDLKEKIKEAGKAEGIKEGKAEGKAEGEKKAKLETAPDFDIFLRKGSLKN